MSNLFHQQNKNNHASKQYILRANTYYNPTSYTKKTKMNTSPGKFVRSPRNLKQEETVSKISQKSNIHFFKVLKAVLQF